MGQPHSHHRASVVVDDLATRLATEDMPPSEVGNRLRALRRGQWFASLPAAFGDDKRQDVDPDARVDSALPFTRRLPDVVAYDAESHALRCANCDNRFDPTSDGIRDAITCCHSLADVDRDAIPICELNLKCSVDERRASPYADAQLRLLQAVYAAHQRRFDPDLEKLFGIRK